MPASARAAAGAFVPAGRCDRRRALLLVLVAGGLGAFWYTGNLSPIAASGAGNGFGALTAKSDAPVREDLEALSHDFRLPFETVRAITWSWTSAIQRNHPDHQRAAIIDAIVFSVQSHGIRGSLQSYFEEYWALAERGLDPTRIRQVLPAQMFRGNSELDGHLHSARGLELGLKLRHPSVRRDLTRGMAR